MSVGLLEQLCDPALLERHIVRLAKKARQRESLDLIEFDGVPLRWIEEHAGAFAKALSLDIQNGQYVPGIARRRRVVLDKPRSLVELSPADRIVQGAFAELLAERFKPHLSPSLHSYRRGRSVFTALRGITRHFLRHRQRVTDPRQRGLWVFRGDVARYTDSIGTTPDGALWGMLERHLAQDLAAPRGDFLRELLSHAVSPEVFDAEAKSTGRAERGVPTGCPITPVIANLYLAPLDDALSRIRGGHFVRYGDDVFFAHPDAEVMRTAVEGAEALLTSLGLVFNQRKRRLVWLTGNGVSAIDYLGWSVSFHGTILPTREKLRFGLRELFGRLERSAVHLRDESPAARAAALCKIASSILDRKAETADALWTSLIRWSSDVGYMRHVDHLIALRIASLAARCSGPRAFRTFPPQALRTQFGLRSLAAYRAAKPAP